MNNEIISIYADGKLRKNKSWILSPFLILLFIIYFMKRGFLTIKRFFIRKRKPINPINRSKEKNNSANNVDFKKLFRGHRWRQVASAISSDMIVLDVGCSSGDFGKLIKSINTINIDGVEMDTDAANKAIHYYRKVIIGDISNPDIQKQLPVNYYDIILFMDVLEHLTNPSNVLHSCLPLKKSGFILASIPNIAYWIIRLKLLLGDFDYTEIGILDRTHLKFYTLKTIYPLFSSAGYNFEWIAASTPGRSELYSPLQFFPKGDAVLIGLLRSFPRILSYQYIVKATISESFS